MKYCSKCGNELLDESVICPRCGCPVNSGNHAGKRPDSGNKVKTAFAIFRCPSDADAASRSNGSYDWNTLANGQRMDEKTLKILDFSMPVMADYDNFHGSAGKTDAKNWLYLPAEIKKTLKK